jgi:hypothetical protein
MGTPRIRMRTPGIKYGQNLIYAGVAVKICLVWAAEVNVGNSGSMALLLIRPKLRIQNRPL